MVPRTMKNLGSKDLQRERAGLESEKEDATAAASDSKKESMAF